MTASAHLIVALEKLREIFPHKDQVFQSPESTFESTRMEANVPNVNSIPGENVFYFDARVLPEIPLAQVEEVIAGMVHKVEKERGVSIEVSAVQKYPAPPATSPDAPVVKALKKAIREVLKREAEVGGIGGATVAAFFRRMGLPSVVWSTTLETAHQPDENCLISQIIGDAQVFSYLFLQE